METRRSARLKAADRLRAELARDVTPMPECWPITTRLANPSDLVYITGIVFATSSTESSFLWRFPHRNEYGQDMYDHLHYEYQNYLESKDWAVVIAEVAVAFTDYLGRRIEDLDQSDKMTTIAVAVWDISALSPSAKDRYVVKMPEEPEAKVHDNQQVTALPPFNRASNPQRIYAWKNILAQARKHYFPDSCGPYLQLQYVATHPQYLRHGAGAAVTEWGLSLANEHDLKVGVFASPLGGILFEYLDFEDVGWTKCRAEGEGRGVDVRVMIWGLEGQEK